MAEEQTIVVMVISCTKEAGSDSISINVTESFANQPEENICRPPFEYYDV